MISLVCRKDEQGRVKTQTSTENSVKESHPLPANAIIIIPACPSSNIHPHALLPLHQPGTRLPPALLNGLHYTAFCKLSELWITRKNTGSCISVLVKYIFGWRIRMRFPSFRPSQHEHYSLMQLLRGRNLPGICTNAQHLHYFLTDFSPAVICI